MEASLNHFVQYDLDGDSSISAIAESLVANEKLVKEAVLLLEALIPGLLIERATVSVRRVVKSLLSKRHLSLHWSQRSSQSWSAMCRK